MAEDTPIYDLMLLLSMSVEDERRAKILADVEAAISSGGGSIVHNGDWGTRPMSYRIQHQNAAGDAAGADPDTRSGSRSRSCAG